MKKTDFDDYAETYNSLVTNQLSFFEQNNDYFAEYKIKKTRQLISTNPKSILDFGCGIGRSLEYFKKYFPEAQLSGCDPSQKSVDVARQHFSAVNFYDMQAIQQQKKQFDLIFLAGVLHHIPPNERPAILELISTLLTPKGNIVVFEHNPYNPLTCHLVNTCPFDEDAVLLKAQETKALLKNIGLKEVTHYYTLFFPHFLRWLRPLENFISFIPLGGQYVTIARF